MSAERPEYYRERAAEERDAAASAPTPAIARTHNDLAAMYDRMASQATERERVLAEQAEEQPHGRHAGGRPERLLVEELA